MKEVINVCHLLPRLGAVSIQYGEENAIESSVHGKNRIGRQAFPVLLYACAAYLHQCVSEGNL